MSKKKIKLDTLINLGVEPKDILKSFANNALETALIPTINIKPWPRKYAIEMINSLIVIGKDEYSYLTRNLDNTLSHYRKVIKIEKIF